MSRTKKILAKLKPNFKDMGALLSDIISAGADVNDFQEFVSSIGKAFRESPEVIAAANGLVAAGEQSSGASSIGEPLLGVAMASFVLACKLKTRQQQATRETFEESLWRRVMNSLDRLDEDQMVAYHADREGEREARAKLDQILSRLDDSVASNIATQLPDDVLVNLNLLPEIAADSKANREFSERAEPILNELRDRVTQIAPPCCAR